MAFDLGVWNGMSDAERLKDLLRVIEERDRLATALRQIFTGAAEPADGLTYSEIADIADKALKGASRE